MLKNKGFTLVEVLVVISMFSFISFIAISSQKITINENQVVKEISLLFTKAKTYSSYNKEIVDIEVYYDCIIIKNDKKTEKYYIKTGYFKEGHKFHYNENGHIYKAKTLSYIGDTYRYDFIFQLGSGTFYVKKQRLSIN